MTAAFVMTKGFKEGFEKFQAAVGGDDAFKVYMREAYKLMVEKLYGWTAPPTAGNKGSRGGQKGGKAMVEMSAAHVFAIREQEYINHLQQRFGGDKIVSGKISNKGENQFSNVSLNPAGDRVSMAAYHDSRRSHRTGRTYATRPTYDRKGADVRDRMIVTKRAYDRHVKQEQMAVGKLKAGWGPALLAAQSKQPAGWVKTAGGVPGMFGTAKGSSEDNINYAKWSGSWDAVNSTGYLRDEDGFINRAAQATEKFFATGGKSLEGFIDRMIKRHSEVKT
jgi:hypothetical protein